MTGDGRPSPVELWYQAGEDPEEYRRLMREAGHLVPGKPEPLPCGRPGPRKPFRILVTASRSWTDAHAVRFALEAAALDAYGREVTVVHGAAGGGDMLTDKAARDLGFTVEAYPAGWDGPCRAECDHGPRKRRRDGTSYCPAAGQYRNAEMVALGAERAVALILPCQDRKCREPRPHGSHGATGCAEMARAAGIPVTPFGLVPPSWLQASLFGPGAP